MTRSRFAAVAALSIPALLVTASGGEAAKDSFRAHSICKTRHTMSRDFAKARTEVMEQTGGHRAGVSRLVPVEDAKVIAKLKDMTSSNGDNVVDGKDVDKTNDDGVAKTKTEFDNFGNYQLIVTTKVNGDVVEREQLDFGVSDRDSGKCDPVLAGAG
jgi:hypothetical protein